MSKELKNQESKWQAEMDAHMLAQYQELFDDKARFRKAVKQAKKEAERLNNRAKSMARVAKIASKKGK